MSDDFFPIGPHLDFSKAGRRLPVSLAQRVRSGNVVPARSLADLTSQKISSKSYDISVAADLGLVTLSAAASADRKVFIHESIRYLDYFDGNEGVRVGVGLRFTIEITILEASARLNGLAAVAAAAELRMAEASVTYEMMGVSGNGIGRLHPKTMDFLSVDNYKLIAEALDRVTEFMDTPDARATPQLLQVSGPAAVSSSSADLDEVDASVDRAVALASIALGETLAKALGKVGATHGRDKAAAERRVRQVYLAVAGVKLEDAAIAPDAQARANARLGGLALPTRRRFPWLFGD
jgi:hypothetical protein